MSENISINNTIYKLSNGEKINSVDLEKHIEGMCHYVQYAIVSGEDGDSLVALIFPNKKLLDQPDYERSLEEGCFCPRNMNELSRCLSGCLKMVNYNIEKRLDKTFFAAIIDSEPLSAEIVAGQAIKISKEGTVEKYRKHLLEMYGGEVPDNEEVYMIQLESLTDPRKNKKNK